MDYGGIMFKKIFYFLFFILIFFSCHKTSENSSGNLNTNYINYNDMEKQNSFFDMKYVYKAVRTDKSNFSNALMSYYQDSYYSNIINRNKEFLNKKIVGDNDIKKYAVDFISNTYHNGYSDNLSLTDLYNGDFSSYYASEYNYVEQNLALKKARDLLLSLKNKDAEVYLALFLSHIACDSLYYFYDMQNYLKEWEKFNSTNISIMIGIIGEGNNINNVYSNKMRLINYIIDAPKDLTAEKLIADAYENNFLKDISKNTGYLDIYNENNYNLSSIRYESAAQIYYFAVIKDIVNTNIMNKYMETYADRALSKDRLHSDVYYENFYSLENAYSDEKYDEFSDMYFLEFNKNTFVYSVFQNKLKDVYYFNPLFIGNTKYASYEIDETFNFYLGDDSKLSASEIKGIKTSDLKNVAEDSKFISDGKFLRDEYLKYLNEILSFPIYNPEFFLCDINNDGIKEIMIKGSYKYSVEKGETASYTLLLKDNLEINLESTIGKSINGSGGQGLNDFQIIYEEEGKNKILLIDYSANTAWDIFSYNQVVNVDQFTYKSYSFKPVLLWKGNIKNGLPEGALKTDAGFDMYKAESDSDKAIISDKTLRIADKLLAYNYNVQREKLNEDGKEKLLENKRFEIKTIQDMHGDISQIENEMLNILGTNS